MHHSGTAEFDPTRTFARSATLSMNSSGAVAFETREVELSRRLGEREVARTKTRLGVLTKQTSEPLGDRSLQMRHRDAFVDAKAFELVEHRNVRHVGRVASEDFSRRENSDRNPAALHRTDLHRRSLRTKRKTGRRVERVLRFAGRMSF